MDTIICPKCKAENPFDAVNCKECKINLKIALESLNEIEHIKEYEAKREQYKEYKIKTEESYPSLKKGDNIIYILVGSILGGIAGAILGLFSLVDTFFWPMPFGGGIIGAIVGGVIGYYLDRIIKYNLIAKQDLLSSNMRRAHGFLIAGKVSAARKVLKSILKSNPKNVDAWLMFAETLSSREEKITIIESCLEYNPDNVKATNAIANLKNELKNSSPIPIPTDPTTAGR